MPCTQLAAWPVEDALERGGSDDLIEAMRRVDQPVEASAEVRPGEELQHYAMHGFGAMFVEVAVDPDLGETRVRRIVGACLRGRPHREPEAGSQPMHRRDGRRHRHAAVDARSGRVPNANLAEYAVPVHADTPAVIDVIFVEEDDPHVNPLGVKRLAELAIVGVAPAITNAVFHATGKRLRELPVTPDKLL